MVDDLQGEKNRRELCGIVEALKKKLERCCRLRRVIITTLRPYTQCTDGWQNSPADFEAQY